MKGQFQYRLTSKGRNPLGELVGNPGCQPGFATSFHLVRLVGCGLDAAHMATGMFVMA